MSQSMWDEVYATEAFVYGKQPNDFLRENYSLIPKGKVLLLAEGEGRNAVFLAEQGYQVTAVDISPVGLEKANRLASENHVEIETVCSDLSCFDLGEKQWDGIVSIFCHLPPAVRQDLYRRIAPALKPSGVFLLEGYTPEQLRFKTGGPPVAEMMLSGETLTLELTDLAFSHLQELEREVVEGVKHNGQAAVIQAIGMPQSPSQNV